MSAGCHHCSWRAMHAVPPWLTATWVLYQAGHAAPAGRFTFAEYHERTAPVCGRCGPPSHGIFDVQADRLTLEQAEYHHIVSVLKQTQWRVDGPQGAARILNVHPSTLRSRMKKLGIRLSAAESS